VTEHRRIGLRPWVVVALSMLVIGLIVAVTVLTTLLISGADEGDSAFPLAAVAQSTAVTTTSSSTTSTTVLPSTTTTVVTVVIDEGHDEPGVGSPEELLDWLPALREFRAWMPNTGVVTPEECVAARAEVEGRRDMLIPTPDARASYAVSKEVDASRRVLQACATGLWLLSYDQTFLRDLASARSETNATLASLGVSI